MRKWWEDGEEHGALCADWGTITETANHGQQERQSTADPATLNLIKRLADALDFKAMYVTGAPSWDIWPLVAEARALLYSRSNPNPVEQND